MDEAFSIIRTKLERAKEKDKPLVIGVGESAHGEEVSWKFRTELMQYLSDLKNIDLVVLCEHADYYVRHARKRPAPDQFEIYHIKNEPFGHFMPHLMPFADRTRVQLESVAEIARLARGHVYGIDIQQVTYQFMWHGCGKTVRTSMTKCGALEEWRNGSDKDHANGAMRNRLNAKIIAYIANVTTVRRVTHDRQRVVIYIAHNEHVSKSAHSETRVYKTDGHYLAKDTSIEYCAIATHSPHLWATWGSTTQALIREDINESYDTKKAFDAVLIKEHTSRLQYLQAR